MEPDTAKDRRFVKYFRTGEDIVAGPEYAETVRKEIHKSWAGVLESDVHYTIKVTPGFPWEEILRLARKERT